MSKQQKTGVVRGRGRVYQHIIVALDPLPRSAWRVYWSLRWRSDRGVALEVSANTLSRYVHQDFPHRRRDLPRTIEALHVLQRAGLITAHFEPGYGGRQELRWVFVEEW